mgnify:CR=1 FL=1
MTVKDRVESLLLIFTGLAGATLWYKFWVMPHDQMRFEVMECMGDRVSEAAYQECHQQLANERGR